MGKLIVIEGTDGSGKSTQFRLLSQRLQQEQVAFRHIVFPSGNRADDNLQLFPVHALCRTLNASGNDTMHASYGKAPCLHADCLRFRTGSRLAG